MLIKERKKRVYTSIFDPFREQIEKCCDEGMTIRDAHKMLPDGYSYQGLMSYIRANHIRENAWKRERDARRVCDKCKYCQQFINSAGTVNVAENRICKLSWRIIHGGVKHCPKWCEYEGTDIEERERVDGNENS